jgi:hypothetical protein
VVLKVDSETVVVVVHQIVVIVVVAVVVIVVVDEGEDGEIKTRKPPGCLSLNWVVL